MKVRHDKRGRKLYTTNMFCPTGTGGGVDPSCGKDKSSASGIVDPIDSANTYIHLGYQINDRLRAGKGMPKWLKEEIDNLDKGFISTPQARTLYRGTEGAELVGKRSGDTFY